VVLQIRRRGQGGSFCDVEWVSTSTESAVHAARHHRTHRSLGAIGALAGQPNAEANSVMFDTTTFTRCLPGEWPSDWSCCRSAASVVFSQRI
jgi:hypothetical protein